MKIGIITFHRAENYGSALQAYALNRYLNENGFHAETIDFQMKQQKQMYRIFTGMNSLQSIMRNALSLLKYKDLKLRKKRFEEFLSNYVRLSKQRYTDADRLAELNTDYDYFICGSDQIWNYHCVDFCDTNLLNFVDNKNKCISYAASMGVSAIEDAAVRSSFKTLLHHFKAISVRENAAKETLEKLLGRHVEVTPDPVVLIERAGWDRIAPPRLIKDKYLLCYYIGHIEDMREFGRRISRETGFQIVLINKNIRDVFYHNHKFYSAGPREFLSLIKHAEFICTDSFHATLFSLIFHKNFWVFMKQGNVNSNSRIEHILKMVGMQDRMIEPNMAQNIDYSKTIDFSNIDQELVHYRYKGVRFIEDTLTTPKRRM